MEAKQTKYKKWDGFFQIKTQGLQQIKDGKQDSTTCNNNASKSDLQPEAAFLQS